MIWDHIEWHLPPEKGWAIIHAAEVAKGYETEWPS